MTELNPKFFKPFIEGTINTFKIQCSVEAKHGLPYIKGTKPQPDFSIAGVIGITSTAFNGNIVLCFPEQVFLGLISKMLGEDFKEITSELQDGASELLNIIFGQAKTLLNNQGYTIEKAIPSVIRGKQLITSAHSRNRVIVLPFNTEFGEFCVEICSDSSL